MSDSLRPYDCSLPGSSVHGLLRQEHWSGLPCSSPGNFPDPRIKLTSLMPLALAGEFSLPVAPCGKPVLSKRRQNFISSHKRTALYLSCILPTLFVGHRLSVIGTVNILKNNNLSSIEQLLYAKSTSKHF